MIGRRGDRKGEQDTILSTGQRKATFHRKTDTDQYNNTRKITKTRSNTTFCACIVKRIADKG